LGEPRDRPQESVYYLTQGEDPKPVEFSPISGSNYSGSRTLGIAHSDTAIPSKRVRPPIWWSKEDETYVAGLSRPSGIYHPRRYRDFCQPCKRATDFSPNLRVVQQYIGTFEFYCIDRILQTRKTTGGAWDYPNRHPSTDLHHHVRRINCGASLGVLGSPCTKIFHGRLDGSAPRDIPRRSHLSDIFLREFKIYGI